MSKRASSFYITYKETQTIGFEGCTTTIKIAEDGSRVALLRFGRANSQLLIEREPAQPLPLRDRSRLPDAGRHRGRHRLSVSPRKAAAPLFSYLLDADDARLVSRNTLEMTVQHVN